MDTRKKVEIFFLTSFVAQDNYLEETMKMRNLLGELNSNHGIRPPTILGVREHVFTGRFGIGLLKFESANDAILLLFL